MLSYPRSVRLCFFSPHPVTVILLITLSFTTAALKANGSADSTTVSPLLTAVTEALDVANTGLVALNALPLHKRRELLEIAERQSGDPLADLVAGIITVSSLISVLLFPLVCS
jgi:hypothetical protein